MSCLMMRIIMYEWDVSLMERLKSHQVFVCSWLSSYAYYNVTSRLFFRVTLLVQRTRETLLRRLRAQLHPTTMCEMEWTDPVQRPSFLRRSSWNGWLICPRSPKETTLTQPILTNFKRPAYSQQGQHLIPSMMFEHKTKNQCLSDMIDSTT